MSTTNLTMFILLAWLIATACGQDEPIARFPVNSIGIDSVDIAHTANDSAGVTVVVTTSVTARSPLDWTVGTVPQLQIGERDDSLDQYQLYRINGITVRGENIVIADGGSRELRFFTQSGAFVRSIGGRGSGPGEFQEIRILTSFWGDSLVIFDHRLQRLQVFSSDGRLGRTVHGYPRSGSPLGAVHNHILSYQLAGLAPSTGYYRSTATYLWTDLQSGQREDIATFSHYAGYRPDSGLGYFGATFPYLAVSSAQVGPEGFFLTSGATPEINEYDLRGDLRRIIRLDEPVQPISQAAFDSLATFMAGEAEHLIQTYANTPLPDRRPVFDQMIIDAQGWLWVKIYATVLEPANRWVVFDLDRRARGIVELPPELEVQYIGSEFVLGRWRAADGVEYVRKYLLRRTQES